MVKIIVSQRDRKIGVIFKQKGLVDKYVIDRADDFLNALDRFRKKGKNGRKGRSGVKGVRLEIRQASILTERIIRAILQGILWQK